MDQDEDYSKTRDELLGRFRESLSKPMSERFFDEDDLIEIFDYAGDLNDDYLRMEALMCGARYFPDSTDLLERRAIFYSNYSDDAREQFMRDNSLDGSIIFDLMTLRTAVISFGMNTNIDGLLDDLLERYNSLNDEETIQLVGFAIDLKQYDWLKSRMPKLREKAQYLSTLLYEVANTAELFGDYAYGAQLMEELVKIEPFNSFFWLLLARLYAQMGDTQKSMSAINYAQAIAPDMPQAVLTRAKIMYNAGHATDEVEKELQPAIAAGDIDSLRFLASLKINEGKNGQARQLLEEVIRKGNPDLELEIIPELITIDQGKADQLFDRFYELNENNNALSWLSWAQQLSMQGMNTLARKAIAAFERNSGQVVPSTIKAEEAFIKEDFQAVSEEINFFLQNVENVEADFPILVVMDIISLLKQGNVAKAYALCDYFNRNIDIDRYPALSTRLEFIGLKTLILSILNLILEDHHPSYWDDFDPFSLWSNR